MGYRSAGECTRTGYGAVGIAIECREKNCIVSRKGYRSVTEYTGIGNGAMGKAIDCRGINCTEYI